MRQYGKGNRQLKTGARLKQILKRNSGITLVELIVTFALISLFAVSCTQIISKAMGAYHKIRGLNYALQVSDTLMEKITGGIEGAMNIPIDEESGDKTAISITDDANIIELRDRTESHICITTTDQIGNIHDYSASGGTYTRNQLLIYYYPVKGASEGEERYKAVDWTYDEAVYMGFSVKTLSFERPALTEGGDYEKNIIKVTLELYSDKYGTFKSERYVRCYNFADEQEQDNIKGGGNGTGGGEGGDPDKPDVPDKPDEPDKYPGTDVPLVSDYWPKQEEWPANDPEKLITVKAGGIFMYEGKYYVVTKDVQVNKQQAAPGPGGTVYGWFNTEQLTGRIVEFEDGEFQKTGLTRGDLCKVGDDYYVFNDGGNVGNRPGNNNQWYKIPR